jgi:arylformamidase
MFVCLFFFFFVKASPIFVYIHGGYWQELSKELSAYCVHPLVKAGIRVIILEYELCPKITLVNLVQQIQKAGIHILKYAATCGSK